MKKIFLSASLTAFLFLLAPAAHAVDYIYKDDRGFQHFQCNNFGGGGVARVKMVGKNKYLVYGGIFKGYVVPSFSPVEAARKACGEGKQDDQSTP